MTRPIAWHSVVVASSLLLSLLSLRASAVTIYVSLDGSDANNGTTSEESVATLARAMSLCGENGVVVIAAGVYVSPGVDIGFQTSLRNVTLRGAGAGKTKFALNETTNDPPVWEFGDVDMPQGSVTLTGLDVHIPMVIGANRDVTISQVNVIGVKGIALSVTGPGAVTIYYGLFCDGEYAIVSNNTLDVLIANSVLMRNLGSWGSLLRLQPTNESIPGSTITLIDTSLIGNTDPINARVSSVRIIDCFITDTALSENNYEKLSFVFDGYNRIELIEWENVTFTHNQAFITFDGQLTRFHNNVFSDNAPFSLHAIATVNEWENITLTNNMGETGTDGPWLLHFIVQSDFVLRHVIATGNSGHNGLVILGQYINNCYAVTVEHVTLVGNSLFATDQSYALSLTGCPATVRHLHLEGNLGGGWTIYAGGGIPGALIMDHTTLINNRQTATIRVLRMNVTLEHIHIDSGGNSAGDIQWDEGGFFKLKHARLVGGTGFALLLEESNNISPITSAVELSHIDLSDYPNRGVIKGQARSSLVHNLTCINTGGCLYLDFNTGVNQATVRDSYFAGNTGGTNTGAAISSGVDKLIIENCTFVGNQNQLTSTVDAGNFFNTPVVTITGCVFQDNTGHHAGALSLKSSVSVVTDCSFVRNYARGVASAIDSYGDVDYPSALTLSGSYFASNTGGSGALQAAYTKVAVMNCIFEKNTAQINQGGAISTGLMVRATIVNITCTDNSASSGGCISHEMGKTFTLRDSRIVGNSGSYGGGVNIFTTLSSPYENVTLHNVEICYNKASAGGGGAFIMGGLLQIHGSKIYGNTVGSFLSAGVSGIIGGGLYLGNVPRAHIADTFFTLNMNVEGQGGGMFVQNSMRGSTELHKCQFSENTAMEGGGIYHDGRSPTRGSALRIHDTRFDSSRAYNSGGQIYINTGLVHVTDSIAVGGLANEGGCVWASNDTVLHIDGGILSSASSYQGGCLSVRGVLKIRRALIQRNTATGGPGGAVLLFQNNGVEVNDTIFRCNVAELGGGGAIYWDTTGGPPPLLSNVTYEDNVAFFDYGNDTATQPYNIAVVQIPVAAVESGDRFSPALQVAVVDYYGNIVKTDDQTGVVLSIGTGPVSAQLIGTQSSMAVGGVAFFPGTGVIAPFHSNLTVMVDVFSPLNSFNLSFPMQIMPCGAGETAAGPDTCQACAAGTYNMDGVTCLPCPAGALCTGGKEVQARGGFWAEIIDGQVVVMTCPAGVCTGNNQCVTGRSGRACRACSDGWQGWRDICVNCTGQERATGAMAATYLAVFIAATSVITLPASTTAITWITTLQLLSVAFWSTPGAYVFSLSLGDVDWMPGTCAGYSFTIKRILGLSIVLFLPLLAVQAYFLRLRCGLSYAVLWRLLLGPARGIEAPSGVDWRLSFQTLAWIYFIPMVFNATALLAWPAATSLLPSYYSMDASSVVTLTGYMDGIVLGILTGSLLLLFWGESFAYSFRSRGISRLDFIPTRRERWLWPWVILVMRAIFVVVAVSLNQNAPLRQLLLSLLAVLMVVGHVIASPAPRGLEARGSGVVGSTLMLVTDGVVAAALLVAKSPSVGTPTVQTAVYYVAIVLTTIVCLGAAVGARSRFAQEGSRSRGGTVGREGYVPVDVLRSDI